MKRCAMTWQGKDMKEREARGPAGNPNRQGRTRSRAGRPAGNLSYHESDPYHESDRSNGFPAAAPKPVIRKQTPAFAATTQRITKPARAKLGVTR